MKIILFTFILVGMIGLFHTQNIRYFPRDSQEYVMFCLPDTLVGHNPDSLSYLSPGETGHGCSLNRRGMTIANLDYPVIKCNICYFPK